jgi:signal transduction histidine kinase
MEGALLDVTERKKAEEELARYRSRLEELVKERTRELEAAQEELVRKQRLAVMGQLTATVSHEIRNPLGTVRSAVFTLGDAVESGNFESVGRALELAERNIVRCDRIIEELLEFTREKEPDLAPVDIDAWLEELLLEQLLPEEIQLVHNLNSHAEAFIDPKRFRRAILNALSNAVHAVQEGPSTEDRIIVVSRVIGERLEIDIKDTGPGISDEVMEKVFEPLFSTKSFGVGLGLPIVKNILEQHRGGVEITSEVGKGTTVTLWAPVGASPASE